MNKLVLIIVAGVALVGCGEKAQEAKNAMNAVQQMAEAPAKMQENQDEAAKFQKERADKGDTVAMPFAELEKFLPTPPSGYTPAEAPAGSSNTTGAFSMSQAAQTFNGPPAADGNTPTIQVTLVDFGGGQTGYGMMAMPMMAMNMSSEDAHQRSGTLKLDVPYTWAAENYNKDSKEAKVTSITRYRYLITVEARNQNDDQSAMVKTLTEDIAKKFDGK